MTGRRSRRFSSWRAALLAGAAWIAPWLPLPAVPVRAELIVFDPNNYAQNLLTAARALQQINNQIQSLENEAQMLLNQARNLASLPYSALAPLQAQIQRTEQLLQQAQRIAYSAAAVNQAFATAYPPSYPLSTSAQQLAAGAQTRWQNALAALQDAMLVQAGAVQNLDTTRTQIAALVAASQSAAGALQAIQSGNQLAALQTNQLADLTAVLAALARAQSLEGARTVENQGQAQVQLSQFLNYGPGYQSQPVQMFH
jgi:type IV secretion system protein TrbJ